MLYTHTDTCMHTHTNLRGLRGMGRAEELEARERVGNVINTVLVCEILKKLKHNKMKLTYL